MTAKIPEETVGPTLELDAFFMLEWFTDWREVA